jgi:integrase
MKEEAINLFRPKVNNESILAMTERVKVIFERRLAAKRPDQIYVFENSTGGPRRYTPAAFKGACERAGLDDVSFHTLRHTFCSTLVAAGATLFEVQALVGHTTPMMTNRYAHLAPNIASNKAVKLLNQRQAGA